MPYAKKFHPSTNYTAMSLMKQNIEFLDFIDLKEVK